MSKRMSRSIINNNNQVKIQNHSSKYTSIINYNSIESLVKSHSKKRIVYYDYSKDFIQDVSEYKQQHIERVMNESNSIASSNLPPPIWNVSGLNDFTLLFDEQLSYDGSSIVQASERSPYQRTPDKTRSIWFKDPIPMEYVTHQGLSCQFDLIVNGQLTKKENTCYYFNLDILPSMVNNENIIEGFKNVGECISIQFSRTSTHLNATFRTTRGSSYVRYADGRYILPKDEEHIDRFHISYSKDNLLSITINGVSVLNPFTYSLINELHLDEKNTFLYFGLVAIGNNHNRFSVGNFKVSLLDNGVEKQENTDRISIEEKEIQRVNNIKYCLVGNIVIRRLIKGMLPLLYLHSDLMETKMDAQWINKSVLLTAPRNGLIGQVFSKNRIRHIGSGFICRFKFKMSTDGADGLAFVIHNSNSTKSGNGGCIGYDGISNSLAVEFDTFSNDDDPYGNHISIQSRGRSPNSFRHRFSLGSVVVQRLNNGETKDVLICYDGSNGSFTVMIDNYHLESTIHNLGEYLGLHNNDEAFVGFTAATGGCNQAHIIEQFELYKLNK